MFEISTYSTEQIIPLIPLLEEWIQREYVQYPYLWVPCEEGPSLEMFVKEKHAMVTIAKYQGQVVGVAAGMNFDSEQLHEYFQQSLVEKAKEKGFDASQILYISFFLTAPEFRNEKHLAASIYDTYVGFARKLGKTKISYWTDFGKEGHPLKPKEPIAIEPWELMDGFKSMGVKLELFWPTLQQDGTVKSESHTAEFFIKDF